MTKIVVCTFCCIAAFALMMIPLAPSVESATARDATTQYRTEQLHAIDQAAIKEKLQKYDIKTHPVHTMKKLVEVVRSELHIMLPGIIIYTLLFLGSFLEGIAIGLFLIIIGAWMQLFAIILIEIVHDLGWELYWPDFEIP